MICMFPETSSGIRRIDLRESLNLKFFGRLSLAILGLYSANQMISGFDIRSFHCHLSADQDKILKMSGAQSLLHLSPDFTSSGV